jgi:GMP synthase (glutamine-hydrolysing)
MRTLIIDNYAPNSPQIEKLYNVISEVTLDVVEIKDYSSMSQSDDLARHDVIILSGSQRKLAEPDTLVEFGHEVEFIRHTEKPILGICFGHQLIASAFGSDVRSAGTMLEGYYMVRKIVEDELFAGLPEKFLVMESHEEYVDEVPYEFDNIADSPNCTIEAMKHRLKPIYTAQFHTERYDDKHPAGRVILENFFKFASLFIG